MTIPSLAPNRSDQILQRLMALHPKVIDLSLGRVERLLAALGHPEHKLPPVVHVAGTNGKGSTLAYLRAFFEAAGKSVHVYTSPHLVRFAERIRVGGQIIAEDRLAALLEECEAANAGAPITFFEITTAAAMLAFSRTPADVLLLEVGLGGRLDATNVIDSPACTIITPISMDHQQFLGDTLAKIAGEKAGILKPGCPAVIAAQSPEAKTAIAASAAELGLSPLWQGDHFDVEPTPDGLRYRGRRQLDLPRPGLIGAHQYGNAAVALAALEAMGIEFAPDILAQGLRQVEWPARLQRLTRGPLLDLLPEGGELWLDGGHNPAAGEMLAQQAGNWADRPLHIVFGMLNTKDAQGFLAPLAPKAASIAAIGIPGEANALSAQEAAARAQALGCADAKAFESAAQAIAAAAQSGPARILICGSLYLAGRILAENG